MNEGWGISISCSAILLAAGIYCSFAKGAEGPNPECTWQVVAAPELADGNNPLGGFAVISEEDIWAVGNSVQGTTRRTLAEHWDGKTWTVVPTPNSGKKINWLTGASPVATDDVWAVGYSMDAIVGTSLNETLIAHWDGKAWSRVDSPNLVTADVGEEFGGYEVSNELLSVAAISKNDVWAVGRSHTFSMGQELITHWDGVEWKVVPSPHPGQWAWLRSVVAVSATDVWALGDYYNEVELGGDEGGTGWVQQNLIEHWDGKAWTVVDSPNVGPTVNGIYSATVVSADDIWAVGGHLVFGINPIQHPTILHWDGVSWSVVPSPVRNRETHYLFGIAARGPNDIFAAGFYDTGPPRPTYNTFVIRWDGIRWNFMESANAAWNNELYGIAVAGTDDVWAAGQAFFEELPYGTLIERYSSPCLEPTPTFIRGNTNGDAAIDIADAVTELGFLFLGEADPPCLDALDVDDNGVIEVTDPINLLGHLFLGEPPPPPPYPEAGPDPSLDDLSCQGAL